MAVWRSKSLYFQINSFWKFFKMKQMLETLQHFAIPLKCWSLQQNTRDLGTMYGHSLLPVKIRFTECQENNCMVDFERFGEACASMSTSCNPFPSQCHKALGNDHTLPSTQKGGFLFCQAPTTNSWVGRLRLQETYEKSIKT